MKHLRLLFILSFTVLTVSAIAQSKALKKAHVMVYTKNGKGYVHDNIPSAVEAIKKLGSSIGFKVSVSDNPTIFTKETKLS